MLFGFENRSFPFRSLPNLLLLCALGVFLIGCGGSGSDSSSTANPGDVPQPSSPISQFQISGNVAYDGPISSANVGIYSTDGTLIHEELKATNSTGDFSFELSNVPASFIIKASGGVEVLNDGTTRYLSEELTRYVNHFDPAQTIGVNILSDVVFLARATEPSLNYSEFELFIRDYLGLPGYYALDEAMNYAGWDPFVFEYDDFSKAMTETGLSDYKQFAEQSARTIFTSYKNSDMSGPLPWKNMPEAWYSSTFGNTTATGSNTSFVTLATTDTSSGFSKGGLAKGILGMIPDILSAVLQGLRFHGTEEMQQILGVFLNIVFEGGAPYPFNAVLENLTAIRETTDRIDTNVSRLWKMIEEKFAITQEMIIGTALNKAMSNIAERNAKLSSWAKSAKEHSLKPGEGPVKAGFTEINVNDWCSLVLNDSEGLIKQNLEIHTVLVPQYGSSLFSVWLERAKLKTGKQDINKVLYEGMRNNFLKVVQYQCLAVNLYAEAARKTYDNATAITRIQDFTKDTLTHIKQQALAFEMAMEEYALNQEWYIYDEAKHDANSKAPDFPGGLATSGVLVDLDTIAQSLGYSELHLNATTNTPDSVNPQSLITVRVVSPAKNAEATDDLGFTGLARQSSYYWDVYQTDPAQPSRPYPSDWKPDGMPVPSEDAPGKGYADAELSVTAVTVLVGGVTHVLDKMDGTYVPSSITGRSPFESRNTKATTKENWKYTFYKFRKIGNCTVGSNLPQTVSMQPIINDVYSWHPNLDQPDAAKPYTWTQSASVAPCITLGAYGLKKPQKTRIMAFHNGHHDEWHDWLFRGYDNNWGKDYLFANRSPAYTFFDTYALGNGWYAFKEAGTHVSRTWSNYPPFNYYGPVLEKSRYRTDGKEFMSVNDQNHILFDKSTITHSTAFQVKQASVFTGRDYTIYYTIPNEFYAHSYKINQPGAVVYSFKTNHPQGIDDPDNNKYIKWVWYAFGIWDRLHAIGTTTDIQENKFTGFMVYPEYDSVANWLLSRPEGWNP